MRSDHSNQHDDDMDDNNNDNMKDNPKQNTEPSTAATAKDNSNETVMETQHEKNCSEEELCDNHTLSEPPLFQFWTGMRDDLRMRWPLYLDDWSRPRSIYTVVNASVFAFVIQLIPALIFAELMDRETNGQLATAEILLSTAIMGILYAVFAGQGLVIMGVTGPVAFLLGTSYSLTEKFDVQYFPFFFWICLWAGSFHVLSAMVGLVSLVWKVTPFTSQIFEFFIVISFIYTSIRDLVAPIELASDNTDDDSQQERGPQYAALFVGLITFYVAWTLHFAEAWVFFTHPIRVFLTSYNTMIAIIVGTAISYLPGVDQQDADGGIERVNIRMVPWNWQPTADRSWIVDPLDISITGVFAAIIPGLMFFLLFIIDHNVSSILTQVPKFNLKKPPAYHWDFFVLGWTFLPCALLGLPPGNGLIPQAPLHLRALCTREYVKDPATGVHHEIVTHCEEKRWSSLFQASLMLVALSSYRILSWIPRGSLFGLLLYLGVAALHGNEIWERVTFCFMAPEKRPDIPVITNVSWRALQAWTAIQVCCGTAIFAVAEFTSVGTFISNSCVWKSCD
jgi:hypothetical protein